MWLLPGDTQEIKNLPLSLSAHDLALGDLDLPVLTISDNIGHDPALVKGVSHLVGFEANGTVELVIP